MKYSKNQVLKVTGNLKETGQMEACIEFALKLHGSYNAVTAGTPAKRCVYQTTDKAFNIGVSDMTETPQGWVPFPFTHNVQLMADIIRANLGIQTVEAANAEKGYQMIRYESAEDPDNAVGVVSFKPYTYSV